MSSDVDKKERIIHIFKENQLEIDSCDILSYNFYTIDGRGGNNHNAPLELIFQIDFGTDGHTYVMSLDESINKTLTTYVDDSIWTQARVYDTDGQYIGIQECVITKVDKDA